jgi:hypothetical protein
MSDATAMSEHYYLYALTRAGGVLPPLGRGVDDRFPVEVVPCVQTAAVASRVGLDRFDVSRLETGCTDLDWLSHVAVRHNQIIAAAARHRPVLPLRLATIFQSRPSLLTKVAHWETTVFGFLRSLGDGEEWAAKIYADDRLTEEPLGPVQRGCPSGSAGTIASTGTGTQYLTRKRDRQLESQARHQQWQHEVQTIEAALANHADRHCRVRSLNASLTGRKEKMIWNAAFLLPRSLSDRWLVLVEELRREAASGGLLLEVSGPWPPYHFCPTLEV